MGSCEQIRKPAAICFSRKACRAASRETPRRAASLLLASRRPSLMIAFAAAYAAGFLTILVLDAVWLTLAVPRLYRPQLGELLAAQPKLVVAGGFYLLYVIGIVVFAVLPAVASHSWPEALGLGALLGLVAYGTYDFTNLATLRNWPVALSLVDVAWGIVLTAVAALAGYAAQALLK
jgi:uncharacterized membrane protein